jgi:hypothetical protein
MTRAQTRSHFARASTRGRQNMDFFCPARGGIRVGYASAALLRPFPAATRSRLRGRAVLILTANRHYSLKGIRPGVRLTAAVARRLRAGRGYGVGRNTWYLVKDGGNRGVLKVQHGRIGEVGLANGRLVTTRPRAARFLRGFGG